MTGTPFSCALRALAVAEVPSLVTSTLVNLLTDDMTFNPAATTRVTSSSRGTPVSPVMAIFMPWTSGAPPSRRPGHLNAQRTFGADGRKTPFCLGGHVTSGNRTPSRAASSSDPRSTPASARTSSLASCARPIRTP